MTEVMERVKGKIRQGVGGTCHYLNQPSCPIENNPACELCEKRVDFIFSIPEIQKGLGLYNILKDMPGLIDSFIHLNEAEIKAIKNGAKIYVENSGQSLPNKHWVKEKYQYIVEQTQEMMLKENWVRVIKEK